MKKITLFDYGAGNLHSLAKVLTLPDVSLSIESDPIASMKTDLLVLPGVGAFANAASRLSGARLQLRSAMQDGLPVLGICLGMQLLMDASEEGPGDGIGIIKGRVRKLKAKRIPHIGWNSVNLSSVNTGAQSSTWSQLKNNPVLYFANSFVCDPEDESATIAYSVHESDRFAAVVSVLNVRGVQFHPEKSSSAGVAFIQTLVKNLIYTTVQ